jgi:tricorn protease
MKKFFLLLTSLFAVMSVNAESVIFASRPSLAPDGSAIYFSYVGDIFKVSSDGGLALRVVSMAGIESNPRVSPDGRYLAFSSNETGNNNVYVVPVKGGEIVQLTFHDAGDVPVSWSPDSKMIYFESNRYNTISTYSVPVEGGTPKRLFANYFNTIANLVQNPVTGEFLFTESTESYRFATRKGYKGEHNSNIISWNSSKNEYREVTTNIGKDIWPLTDTKGNLYYVSDELNGQDNIVKLEGNTKKWITKFDESVQYPAISADGSKIVYLKGYKITLSDTQSGKSVQPEIEVVENRTVNDASYKVETPQDAAVSPDGKKLAFAFRGLLFVSDVKGNFVQQINTPSNERIGEVVWGDDSKTLYYTRTNLGFLSLIHISEPTRPY